MRIDAHQHFWQLARADYSWLSPEMAVLYRDYLPEDLIRHLERCQIEGTVLVQAAATVAETEYMLSLADRHDFIKGVVGWVDFDGMNAIRDLERLAKNQKFKGVRPMIQDMENIDWMLSDWLDPVFKKLIELDLCFDALVKPEHLSNLLILLKRYPDLKVVIDHGAKPNIVDRQFDAWAKGMARLASETGAYCKVSGLWTEAGGDVSLDAMVPYMAHLLESFGPDRLMWCSDWPVLNLAGEYGDWFSQAKLVFVVLKEAEQNAIFGGNAEAFYGL